MLAATWHACTITTRSLPPPRPRAALLNVNIIILDDYQDVARTFADWSRLPDDTTLFPGHLYSPEGHDSMGAQKRTNPYLRAANVDMFLGFMGY